MQYFLSISFFPTLCIYFSCTFYMYMYKIIGYILYIYMNLLYSYIQLLDSFMYTECFI